MAEVTGNQDPWENRHMGMHCDTCMFYVPKKNTRGIKIGRCRRHSPSMGGYPVCYDHDWCGDHKVDENKLSVE